MEFSLEQLKLLFALSKFSCATYDQIIGVTINNKGQHLFWWKHFASLLGTYIEPIQIDNSLTEAYYLVYVITEAGLNALHKNITTYYPVSF